jgi:hypothetical protein
MFDTVLSPTCFHGMVLDYTQRQMFLPLPLVGASLHNFLKTVKEMVLRTHLDCWYNEFF